MLLLKVHLLPFDKNENDDILEISRAPGPHDLLELEYIPGKGTHHRFWLNRRDAEAYVHDLIEGLTHDTDPWDKIQFTPVTGPAVMYFVSDLGENDVRRCIMNTVHTLLLADVQVSR